MIQKSDDSRRVIGIEKGCERMLTALNDFSTIGYSRPLFKLLYLFTFLDNSYHILTYYRGSAVLRE